MQKKSPEQIAAEEQQKLEERMKEERQKLVVQIVKLPNGATFTRLKPVTVG